jgi:hypothetical protein
MTSRFLQTCEGKTDSGNAVDFDIHGLVGVRLVAPSPTNVAAVSAQIGPPSSRVLRRPDIVVRYVDRLAPGTLHYVDLGKTASSKAGFIVFPEGDGEGKVSIPFEQIGSDCEIFCERRVGWIPLLIPIINLTALKKHRCVPIHASAFVHKGTGVLVTGWVKSGKSEALLAFSQHGATYVGGEWVLLSCDGNTMYGLPGTFRMWEWQRRQLSHLEHIGGNAGIFRLIRFLDTVQRAMPRGLASFGPLKLLREGMPALRRQLNFRVEPKAIFGDRCGRFTGHPDKIFIGMVHSDERVLIEPAEPATVADQLAFAMEFELTSLMSQYRAFKFALPGMRNEFLEKVHTLLRDALQQALAAKEIYMLYHPYPVSFRDLFQVMRNFLECPPPVERELTVPNNCPRFTLTSEPTGPTAPTN